MIRHALLVAAASSLPVHAGEAEPLTWTLEEFASSCIPLWHDALTGDAEDCTVAEFGEVGKLEGITFHYARYHDRTRPIPEERSQSTEFNALVILRTDSRDREKATVDHVRKLEDHSYQGEFLRPVLLHTSRGAILHLPGRGPGDSHSQYSYDDYWLWRSGSWVEVDVHSWVYDMRKRMPDGYRLKGIIDLAPSLKTLEYVTTSVLRDGDADCCPTGGTVSIRFKWDDLTLRAESFEHDPGLRGGH